MHSIISLSFCSLAHCSRDCAEDDEMIGNSETISRVGGNLDKTGLTASERGDVAEKGVAE